MDKDHPKVLFGKTGVLMHYFKVQLDTQQTLQDLPDMVEFQDTNPLQKSFSLKTDHC